MADQAPNKRMALAAAKALVDASTKLRAAASLEKRVALLEEASHAKREAKRGINVDESPPKAPRFAPTPQPNASLPDRLVGDPEPPGDDDVAEPEGLEPEDAGSDSLVQGRGNGLPDYIDEL